MGDDVERRLRSTVDATVWAKEFCAVAKEQGHDLDEGWMITWFANAIEIARMHERTAIRSVMLDVVINSAKRMVEDLKIS
jgi:hypothetical protein